MGQPKPVSDFEKFSSNLKTTRLLRSWEFKVELFGYDFKNLKIPIYASATALPGREVSDIELPIGGTTVKYPGPPTYSNSWTVTFRDDVDLTIRRALDKHMGPIAWYKPTEVTFQKQFNAKLSIVGGKSTIKLENAYISNIGEVTMDYSTVAIATYVVTFNYHRWSLNE